MDFNKDFNLGHHLSFIYNATDQEQDRRQTCLPEGLTVAFAGCEALREAQQVADP